MNFAERQIEDLIYDTLLNSPEMLEDRGLIVSGYPLRQVDLGNYGRLDILTIDFEKDYNFSSVPITYINFTVIELKKSQLEIQNLLQLVRYMAGLRRYAKRIFNNKAINISGKLIGNSISTNSDWVYLFDLLGDVEVLTYEPSLENGIIFTDHRGYYSTGDDKYTPSITKSDKILLKEKLKKEIARFYSEQSECEDGKR